MADNKRYFRCSDELWEAFNQTVKADSLAKDKSDKLRELMKEYIKSQRNIKDTE